MEGRQWQEVCNIVMAVGTRVGGGDLTDKYFSSFGMFNVG